MIISLNARLAMQGLSLSQKKPSGETDCKGDGNPSPRFLRCPAFQGREVHFNPRYKPTKEANPFPSFLKVSFL